MSSSRFQVEGEVKDLLLQLEKAYPGWADSVSGRQLPWFSSAYLHLLSSEKGSFFVAHSTT